MTNELLTTNWYENFIEECVSSWQEKNWTLAWGVIERNHSIGETIRRYSEQQNASVTHLVQLAADKIQCSETLIWQCLDFFDKFPDMNALPEGKAMNWTKIRNELLPNRSGVRPEPVFDPQKPAERLLKRYGPEKTTQIHEQIGFLLEECHSNEN